MAIFPPELEDFAQLEELSLAGNQISGQLPSFVQNFEQLAVLNLSNNNIDTWTRHKLLSVSTLDLSKNKINSIDETAFAKMPSLFYLNLAENRINNLPTNVILQSNYLYTLDLSRNLFNKIPNIRTNSLRSLDLSSCQLTTLEANSLEPMESLWEINLSLNAIDSIPDNLSSNSLQIFDLSYNDISMISDYSFSALPHLAVLDLRGNDFKEVWYTSHFSSNPYLREVRVKGNRWSCEGFGMNLLLMYEFLTKEPAKVADPASLICYSPSNVTQLTWQDAYMKTWHDEPVLGNFTITAILIGIIIGVIVTSIVCRMLMGSTKTEPPRVVIRETETQNLNPAETNTEPTVLRIHIAEDLPPSYDEALLMPRLNASFHSLPELADDIEEVERVREFRRSRSSGDLVDSRPRDRDRRSVRSPRTVHIEE